MGSVKEKRALSRLLKDTIVHLCKANTIYGGQIDVDGIICITGQKEGQELVIKVHERLGPGGALRMPMKPMFPDGFTEDVHNNNQGERYVGDNEGDELYDYSMPHRAQNGGYSGTNGQIDHEGEGSDSELPPSKKYKVDNDMDGMRDHEHSREASPFYMDEQAEDLSSTGGMSNSDDIAPSPSGSDTPNKSQYLGRNAYLPSPYHLQKKTPLRTERWTPTMPVPTTPECKACGFTFENFDVLSEHNEAVHSVFTCNSCYKTFTSRSNLERHSRLHTGFKPYVCAICQKAFSRKDHLSNHAAKHAFKCATCNKRFADKKTLATHFTYDHEAMLSHICDFCNKGFSDQVLYEEHVKTHPQYHAVQKTFHANRSPASTPSATSPQPRKHACNQCTFTSQDRIVLLKHRLLHSNSQRCYTCLSCAKTFPDPLNYDDHLMAHQGEHNVFECVLCRQIFPTYEVLKRHELVHGSEDSEALASSYFPCPQCDRVFRDNPTLQDHMMLHKSMERRKHRCNFCNMGFGTYVELSRHMQELRHYMPQHHPLMPLMPAMPMPTDLSLCRPDRREPEQMSPSMSERPSTLSLPATPQEKEEERKVLRESLQESEEIKEEEGPKTPEEEEIDMEMEPQIEVDDKPTEKNGSKQNGEVEHRDEMKVEKEEQRDERRDSIKLEVEKLENDLGSDIEVVEPEAPEEDANNLAHNNDRTPPPFRSSPFVVTENTGDVIEVGQKHRQEERNGSIKSEPLRSLLGLKSSMLSLKATSQKDLERSRRRKGPSPEKFLGHLPPPPPYSEPLAAFGGFYRPADPYEAAQDLSMKTTAVHSTHAAAAAAAAATMAEEHLRAAHERYRLDLERMERERIERDRYEKMQREREHQRTPQPTKPGIEIPPGPQTCSVCNTTYPSFHEMETHCFVEHNRSPCMFCSKTFAQKANRDRHVCLHTGDKPYACPDCDEKFSRGDKLKLHRVRMHNLQVTPLVGKNKDGGIEWSSPSTNQSEDSWVASYRKDSDIVHAAGEWSMVNDAAPMENGGILAEDG